MPLRLSVEHGPFRDVPRRELTRRAQVMGVELQIEDLDVSILLTNDDQIHQLNRDYRHKDKPTDVLAFAQREGELAELAGEMLGDVVISVETARVQARARGATTLDEVTFLLAHGLLHLLGWDHETAAKDLRMRAETERLLALATKPVRVRRPAVASSKTRAGAALTRKTSSRAAPAGTRRR